MEQFGAQAMIPQAVTYGLFKDIGPLVAAVLVAGRVGAGIGAELAGMRVNECGSPARNCSRWLPMDHKS
jgi:phospholipid/cholesterol/gamma-HCH transport system permease protein